MASKQVKTINIKDASIFDNYNPGDKVYLVFSFDKTNTDNEWYTILDSIPVTTRGVERPQGWLGNSGNINKTALGFYKISSLERLKPDTTKIVLYRYDTNESLAERPEHGI